MPTKLRNPHPPHFQTFLRPSSGVIITLGRNVLNLIESSGNQLIFRLEKNFKRVPISSASLTGISTGKVQKLKKEYQQCSALFFDFYGQKYDRI